MGTKCIAIVGAGCSGVLTAAELLRHPSPDDRTIVLVDRRATLGSGTAFGTRRPCHLLNVPAARMSAFPDDPSHFLRWAHARDSSVGPHTFVARSLYGDYLRTVLADAAAEAGPRAHLETVTGVVCGVTDGPDGRSVQFDDGSVVEADTVVLALGNIRAADPPGTEALVGSDRYTTDPWAPGALESVGANESVLLIGTGLTAVDVLLALQSRGHRGKVYAVSRHGLLPKAHLPHGCTEPVPVDLDAVLAERTTRGLVRALRREVVRRDPLGGDWREVIDALRPYSQQIWQNLPIRERRQFVCRIARYWDVHRHRMAPEVARSVEGLRRINRFQIVRGRVSGAVSHDEHIDAEIHTVDGNVRWNVGHVVNCTGPSSDVVHAGDPVIDSLVNAGLVRNGPLGLGLDTDDRGALIDACGRPGRTLWTIGSMRRGGLWETTVVPEIRTQADDLAAAILT